MHTLRPNSPIKQRQRGAVFIVMLVILIMGVIIALTGALSKVTLHTALNEKSSDMLAQAKEVVIGYAVKGVSGVRPGDLLIPDVLSSTETPPYNYDGMTEGGCLDASKLLSTPIPGLPVIGGGAANWTNMRCIGRLPWKNFSMPIASPSENDPTGFMPWYAVSANLVDPTHVTLNSELLNTDNTFHGPNNYPAPPHPWLTVRDMNGNVLSNRVAFVLIIPGATLPNQSRPASPNLNGANHYLDSITVPATCTAPCVAGTYNNFDMDDDFIMGDEHRWINDPANPGKQIEDSTYSFNDKLIYVTIDELMPLIEKRIAREVKACLDDYAATNTYHRYPWAAPVSDITAWPNRTGTYNVLFGRMSEIPNINTSAGGSPPPTGTLLTNLNAVQTALTAYINGTGSLNNLKNKGDTLKDYAQSIGQAPTDPARAAGITADNCAGMSCTATLQNQLNQALCGGSPDGSMSCTWTTVTSCNQMVSSSYWPDWRDLVFYQIADGCHPTSNTNDDCRPGGATFAPLHISGSGNPVADNNTYRAAVVIAGKTLTGQTRPSTASPPNNYLETAGGNSHQSVAGVTPVVNFTTYKSSDTANYSTVNDLVLCLDGKNYCK